MLVETVPIDSIHADPANVRKHDDRNLAAIKASLARFGQQKPLVVDSRGIVRAGNGTLDAARELGWKTIAIVRTGLTGSEATAYAVADNRTAELATWDDQALAETLRALQSEDFDLDAVGFTDDEIGAMIERLGDEMIDTGGEDPPARLTLAERFGVPPFSVLDARQGYWQERKRQWIALGIQSELGRGGGLLSLSDEAEQYRMGEYERERERERERKRASPGGSLMPAGNYSKNRSRGDGRGQPIMTATGSRPTA